ncbi:MAG: lytic murein transglycosylase [Desulfobacteraceae bacterium]|nr:lytic murein transglycosylase [Desulfobacteraceae bacterium]
MRNVLTLLPDKFSSLINVILIILMVAAIPMTAYSADENISFQTLETRLIKDKEANFTAEKINRIYNNPGVFFDIKGVSSYFRHQEGKLNYDQFLSSKSIKKANDYMRAHHADLLKAEMDYGVDKEVITAIMLVETRFGAYVGNRPVISILSTMAVLEDKTIRDRFWNKIPTENRVTREEYEKKAIRKSKWAYKELIAFITYVEKEGMDPYNINGSYAGAMGLCQFMPSNIVILAEDGNKDGIVNLFHHADAIASIANYLKHYGWKPGISRDKAGKVVHHYNHSSYYVEIVLKIIDELKT